MLKNQRIHRALAGTQQFISQRIKKFFLANLFPLHMKPGSARKLCKNRQNRSSITFKKWMSMCEKPEDFSRMSAQKTNILPLTQSIFRRSPAISRMRE